MNGMTIDAHGNIHEANGQFGGHIRTDAGEGTIPRPANPILKEFRDEYTLANTSAHRRAIIDQWLAWTDEPDEDAPWVVQERPRPMLEKTHRILTLLRKLHAEDELAEFIVYGDTLNIDDDSIVILQHAEGDFDAAGVGFESLELYRDDETGDIVATAVTDLDLHWLNRDEDWLEDNFEHIEQAFTELYPGGLLTVPDVYDNAEFRFGVSRPGITDITAGDAVRLVTEHETAQQFIADAISDALWNKLGQRVETLINSATTAVTEPAAADEPDVDEPDLEW